ncbi:hypothetical protein [Planktothrix sp. PCC 11201]|uniref:hypothetical protein n=1 Tax=Planktothrix sp. PCC 11201 TaxID=1729650 RepID=UPI0009A88C98|nr:hypothetical protein [Planktothrix sp. PCC 11201]
MDILFSSIPSIPDLTHPNELMELGSIVIKILMKLAIFLIAIGVILSLINWSMKKPGDSISIPAIKTALEQYLKWMQTLPHLILIVLVITSGFFLCSTLANRYHNWEQQRITQIATTVAGERLEQTAPKIRYEIEEPFTDYKYIEGKTIEIKSTRIVPRWMTLSGSKIQVKINQTTSPETKQWIYSVDFVGEYQVKNQLKGISDFFFEVPPPYGYLLLQDFQVEQNGKSLVQVNPGDYGFPFKLPPGETTNFKVTYQAQGAPRWVYQPGEQLLSNFSLNVLANFPDAEFAGAVPTITKEGGENRQLSWIYEGNISVKNPLGIFTATAPIRNTGVIPRLLLLAPAIFLWWIILLYLSLPLTLGDVAIVAGLFFACLLTLTYSSRLIDAKLAWTVISPVLLLAVWGLGKNRQASWVAIICTISGGILPIFGLLVPYSGITLSVAGLLSGIWLAFQHWYELGKWKS